MNDREEEQSNFNEGCFRCHHCAKAIEEGMAVYMCRDASYCSASCRRRGRAELQRSRTYSESVSAISSALSETSVTESSASSHCEKDVLGRSDDKGGVFGWILGKAVRKLASMVQGTELLRTLSGADYGEYPNSFLEHSGNSGSLSWSRQLQEGDLGQPSDFVRLIEGNIPEPPAPVVCS